MVIGPELPPPLDTYLVTPQIDGPAIPQPYTTGIIFYAATPTDDDYLYLCLVEFLTSKEIHFGSVLDGAVVEVSPGVPQILSLGFTGSARFQQGYSGDTLSISPESLVFLNATLSGLAPRVVLPPAESLANGATGAVSTTSATFVTTGIGDIPFTKIYSEVYTQMVFDLDISCFMSAIDTGTEFGVQIRDSNSVLVDTVAIIRAFINTAGAHTPLHGKSYADALPAGDYTARIVFRRTAGGATVHMDVNDTYSLEIGEAGMGYLGAAL